MKRRETRKGQGTRGKARFRDGSRSREQQVPGCREVAQDPRLSEIPGHSQRAQNSRRRRGGVSRGGAGGAPAGPGRPRPRGCLGEGKEGRVRESERTGRRRGEGREEKGWL